MKKVTIRKIVISGDFWVFVLMMLWFILGVVAGFLIWGVAQ